MLQLDILNPGNNFEEMALAIFQYQALNNPVYNAYLKLLNIDIAGITTIESIPFLPISFFKTHKVISTDEGIELVFKSSGTGLKQSTHYIANKALYEASFVKNFEKVYGDLSEIQLLALLPNYEENKQSSLLYMVNHLIDKTSENDSKYLNFYEKEGLVAELKKANKSQLKVVLIGVSFALIDLAENYNLDLSNLIVIETGGMKGKRKEITRSELHQILKKQFNAPQIHSEYGMCELLSQAYCTKDELFEPPPWVRVYSRPIEAPFGKTVYGATGVLKIIDFANFFSCSFIETEDIGIVYENGFFNVLGRIDYSALRGCNLMHQ